MMFLRFSHIFLCRFMWINRYDNYGRIFEYVNARVELIGWYKYRTNTYLFNSSSVDTFIFYSYYGWIRLSEKKEKALNVNLLSLSITPKKCVIDNGNQLMLFCHKLQINIDIMARSKNFEINYTYGLYPAIYIIWFVGLIILEL